MFTYQPSETLKSVFTFYNKLTTTKNTKHHHAKK